jgi:hypothetical protein
MSNIDFTKPVETVTGIPVQIISTSGREPYPVVGYVGEHSLSLDEWTSDGLFNIEELDYSDYNLRNKATWQLPDPYAELKAAHAAGKVIQFNPGDSLGWRDQQCDFTAAPHCYRIKPEQQPQEPWAAEKAAFAAGETIQYSSGYNPAWSDVLDPMWLPASTIQGPRYRIKPKTQKVPLEPCDVPPGSVFRAKEYASGRWKAPVEVSEHGVNFERRSTMTFQQLFESGWQIKRPTDTEWQPCYKETQP